MDNSATDSKLSCNFCKKKFKTKHNVYRHVRGIHGIEPQSGWKKIKCPAHACSAAFSRRTKLREHIQDVHKVVIEVQEARFRNYEDFKVWKDNVEKQMKCSYILNQTPKVLQSVKQKIMYFSCHRSGFFSTKESRQRKIKSLGSVKINGCCPSSMDVTVSPSSVRVVFWKTHFGHGNEVSYLFLTHDERRNIAEKLKQGITFDRILNDVRDTVGGNQLERIHLVTRRDLHNISRDFHIFNSEKLHQNEALSVGLWVDTMKELEDSPVVFHKERGKKHPELDEQDFILILMTKFQQSILKIFGPDKVCMDIVHGTSAYNLNLFALLTVDEYGCSFPAAYCISNRGDEIAMSVFLEMLRTKVGCIVTTAFMCDDRAAFYSTWEKIMGPSEYRLLCSWHVDCNWRTNLSKISGPKEKKKLVYKSLKILLQERQVQQFNRLLDNFLQEVKEDEDTEEFGEYFEKTYSKRPEMWAFCFRPHFSKTINMQLESMHKTLKDYYLEGKKIRSVDKTVHMLLKLTRDKIFERLNKLGENVPPGKLIKIRDSHRRSKGIKLTMITEIEENRWQVESTERDGSHYTVEKVADTCSDNCVLFCSDCNICIHVFTCTCVDSFINYNICEHIHACIGMMSESSLVNHYINEISDNETPDDLAPDDLAFDDLTSDDLASDDITENASSTQCTAEVETKMKTTIKKKLSLLNDILRTKKFKPDTYLKMEKLIDMSLSLCSDGIMEIT